MQENERLMAGERRLGMPGGLDAGVIPFESIVSR